MGSSIKGACIIGQSGGPTSVINCSAYGMIRTALDSPCITRVLGAANGIRGVLDDVLYDLGQEDAEELALLMQTPASALGSCRYKLKDWHDDDTDYLRILEIFQKYDVRYFFYNGGNDSMDTCAKISEYMKQVGYECRIIGVPKTIDNDLYGTDHCPGFASAAKYVATACMEIYHDSRVYDAPNVCVLEIMGRHAGWLAAASSIACSRGYGPDLIYLPEVNFDVKAFLLDVQAVYDKTGKCFIAVSEGIHDKNGKLIAEYGAENAPVDSFGHKQLGGLATTLIHIIKDRLGYTKARGIELSLLQRCGAHWASKTDCDEAFLAGKAAVENAVAGVTDKMIAFERLSNTDGSYGCGIKLVGLDMVANAEKKLPRAWINDEGNGVKKEYLDYVLPLIQGCPEIKMENGLPRYARLKKVRVETVL